MTVRNWKQLKWPSVDGHRKTFHGEQGQSLRNTELGKPDLCRQQNEAGPSLTSQTKINTRRIKDPNIRAYTVKPSEESRGESPPDTKFGNDILLSFYFLATVVQFVEFYFPDQRLNPGTRQWQHRVLTTGLPGDSLAIWHQKHRQQKADQLPPLKLKTIVHQRTLLGDWKGDLHTGRQCLRSTCPPRDSHPGCKSTTTKRPEPQAKYHLEETFL